MMKSKTDFFELQGSLATSPKDVVEVVSSVYTHLEQFEWMNAVIALLLEAQC